MRGGRRIRWRGEGEGREGGELRGTDAYIALGFSQARALS